MTQEKAKKFADRHGFKLRRVSHSTANPNGYVKVIAPDGKEDRINDWTSALQFMQGKVFKK